jgi:hypothetical protein
MKTIFVPTSFATLILRLCGLMCGMALPFRIVVNVLQGFARPFDLEYL